MARQHGILRLTGKLGDLSFYSNADGYFVRQSCGHDAERIKNDPAFARTRENSSEFTDCINSGKLLRDSLFALIDRAKDNQVTQRVVSLLNDIKDLDLTSDRGKRKVYLGMQHPDALAMLTGFNFNKDAVLSYILANPIGIDLSAGTFSISQMIPQEHLHFPPSATHAEFRGGWLRVNLETKRYEVVLTDEVLVEIDSVERSIVLACDHAPTGTGVDIYVLMVCFKQQLNGIVYDLKDKRFNASAIVGFAGA